MPMPSLRPAAPERFLDPEGEAARAARLAGDGDVPVVSPVHRLQHELSIFEGAAPMAARAVRPADLYPGWFRVGFPVGVSVMLWTTILWGIRSLL